MSPLRPFTKLQSVKKKNLTGSGAVTFWYFHYQDWVKTKMYASYILSKSAAREKWKWKIVWIDKCHVATLLAFAAHTGELEATNFMTACNFTRDNLEIQSVIFFPESFRARLLLQRGSVAVRERSSVRGDGGVVQFCKIAQSWSTILRLLYNSLIIHKWTSSKWAV